MAGKPQHGLSGTNLYTRWMGMIGRCYVPSNTCYPYYGGRGIIVCDRWRNSPVAFCEDMGEPPTRAHTIERIDNAGNYEPANCRWATKSEQQHNKRGSISVEWRGATRNVSELAREHGLNESMFRERIKRGWSVERALTTPVMSTRQHQNSP